ncbi:MAG: DMT family transporter [Alphaproteobacteria bacterium]|mgnify:CR=1 FL=1|nr:DMT family transporter [Alphaproteobacteria bacterium]
MSARLPTGRSASDWSLFCLLTLFWAGAYALTRVAVDKGNPEMGLPVAWVLPGRLVIGAVVLWIIMLARGQRLPPLADRRRWLVIISMGLTGSVFPFFLITTAQQTVNSSLAALYTAAVPIFVASGATFLFHDEKMTRSSLVGVLIGFAGIVVLFGPDAMKGLGDASVIAQILLILATVNYAVSSLVARGAPVMEAMPFATGFVTVAAIVSLPLAFTVTPSEVNADWSHWGAVLALGIGPSAVAQALYMFLIARTSATFLSLTGYSIPVVSAALGWLFFRETQSWQALVAFVLILGGVWLARGGGGVKEG